nr:MAG TPA: putative head-tail adaptor [Caudoviricetes sp.]
MAEYKPSPLTTPAKLLTPTYQTIKGVRKKVYPEDGELIWCSFKTYGGTEREINEVYSIEDTANVETWFRPDIKSDCRIMLAESGATYEILNEPENINLRNQYCKFKVRRIKGGA